MARSDKIVMYQQYRLRKMSAPDSNNMDIPAEFRKFAGNYQFAPAKLSVDVMFDKNVMNTQEPLEELMKESPTQNREIPGLIKRATMRSALLLI